MSHASVVVNWRLGCGGNLIPQYDWDAFNAVRAKVDDSGEEVLAEFSNPFMVWARVIGGDHGYWTGKEVAQQFKYLQEHYEWQKSQPDFKARLNELDHPIKDVQMCIHTDRSQTHLMAKPDGIVMAKFNKGTSTKSATNARSANKFCIPRDVVLELGDVNHNPEDGVPVEASEGDVYSFKLTDTSYKGLQQIARELGWAKAGMRKGPKTKKKRFSGGDIFINRATNELVRVMKSHKDHTKFHDLRGTISARPFVFVDGAVPQFTLMSVATHDIDIAVADYIYVRPSNVIVIQGDLKKAAGLRIYLDIDENIAVSMGVAANNPTDPDALYHDEKAEEDDLNLETVLGKLPLFLNELPLIEQIVADAGNLLSVSPIVHCELAGRGVEYTNGRAKWDYRNKCTGQVNQMEKLCRDAYSSRNIPQDLMAKFERRVRDYMRSYRMGVMATDLEKMRKEIKTHRNMLDCYESFIKSETTDDPEIDLVIHLESFLPMVAP